MQPHHTIRTLLLALALMASTSPQRAAQRYLRQLRQLPPPTQDVQDAQSHYIDGVVALLLNQPEQAHTHLQQALRRAPHNAAIHYKLAQLLQQYPQLATDVSAHTHIYAALALAPHNSHYHTSAVQMHSSQGDYAQAARVYEQMFQHIPPTDEQLQHLAQLYTAQQAHRQAIRVYNQLEQRHGISPTITQHKQSIYLDMNDLDGAVREGLQLIRAHPHTEAHTIRLAQLLTNNDQGHRAIPHLQQDLATHPHHAHTRWYLAHLLLAQSHHAQAHPHITATLQAPSLPLQQKLTLLHQYIQHLPPGATHPDPTPWTQTLSHAHPHNAQVHTTCGRLHQALGHTAPAHHHYQQALDHDPDNYDHWKNIITLHSQQGTPQQVLHWTQKALQHFPEQVALYYHRGHAYYQQQQYQQAIRILEKGKQLTTTPAQTQLFDTHLGDAHQALQQDEQAIASYEAALRTAPDDCYTLNNYSYLLALRKRALPLAQKMATKLIQQHPDNPCYLDTYAWVLYQMGQYKKAKKYLKKALSLDKAERHTEISQHYHDVLKQLGQHPQ